MKLFTFITLVFIAIGCTKSSSSVQESSSNDIPKSKPEGDDWMLRHKEEFISVADFKKKFEPIEMERDGKINLYVIGNTNPELDLQFEQCRKYLEAFFQRDVTISLGKALIENSNNSRRKNGYALQYNAQYILDSILNKDRFKTNLATMALTNTDVYPRKNWNYVFGLADYSKRVGITSVFRFQSSDPNTELERLLKISSHEISHMFGISHCITNECVMNGVNHLGELDRNPLRMCSICAQKLTYRLGYNPKDRLRELLKFLKEQRLQKHFEIVKKDL